MRRKIKPIVVLVFFILLAMVLIIGKRQANHAKQKEVEDAKSHIPIATSNPGKAKTSTSETEDFILNPIVDVSGWQLPEEIDYDTLSRHISGAIVRVYGGSQITAHNNAAFTTGIDKSFKTHIKEFQNEMFL
ncbi:hypothetical protein HMPREF1228_0427 [Streptococcus pyogenes GA41345]|nr:hypothetical protein HMPREF1228_0427 [Streptococcus pyogenes GA41345]